MNTLLVLTVVGPDRPGLVNSLSERVAAVGATWTESRMARLAGKFAGIVAIEVARERADELSEALRALQTEGLTVVVEAAGAEPAPTPRRELTLELTGHDHPGIVADISGLLAELGINIEEFESHCTSASMAGGELFQARARLAVPDSVSDEQLRRQLERHANELMVDIALQSPSRR